MHSRGIKVLALSTVLWFQGRPVSVPRAGRLSKAEYVINGTLAATLLKPTGLTGRLLRPAALVT